MRNFTCLEVYCNLNDEWASKREISKNIESTKKEPIVGRETLKYDLKWLVEIGLAEKRLVFYEFKGKEICEPQYRLARNQNHFQDRRIAG